MTESSFKPTVTPSQVGHRAKKRFGQNFLHDRNVIDKIVRSIKPERGQPLIEIGPGLGALTQPILAKAGAIDVVEMDRDVIPPLQAACAGHGELRVHQGDALAFDFSSLPLTPPLRLIGNLPYNISSPLLFHLLEQPVAIVDMHFMLQLEVVQRMVADPGNKQYGRLTVMLNYHSRCELLFKVPPGAFNPPPKVTSAIVRIIPHTDKPAVANSYEHFSEVVRSAFGQRRKMLSSSLKGLISAGQFDEAGVDPKLRPEQLSCEQFVRLANTTS